MSDLIGTAVRALGESLGVEPAEVGDDIVVRCRVVKLAPAAEAVIRATLAEFVVSGAALLAAAKVGVMLGYDDCFISGTLDESDAEDVLAAAVSAFAREHGLELDR